MEVQNRQLPPEPQFGPPKNSLIPPGHSTGTPSPIRSVQGREQGPREPFEITPIRRAGGQGGKTSPKSPHSPNQVSQKEERDSVIDAVKLITRAQTETRGEGGSKCGEYSRV